MKLIWQGQYLDGKTSSPREVEIRPLKDGLRIEQGRDTWIWPYSEIRQVQGHYAGEPVRLERGEGITEALTIPDTDFLITLRAKARGQAGRFHNPGFRRTRFWLTVSAGLATLVVSFVTYRWGIPAMAERVAARVPVSWEEGLGESTLNQMAPPKTRLHNPALDRAILKILVKLVGTLPQCSYRFQVIVSNLPIVNAFALPGGNILVYRGLLEQTSSPEELAGVLAHEMQHVLKRHTTRRLIQESSTGLLISALSGDFTGSMAFGLKSASSLALMKYDRDEEAEADRDGMKMILAAGIEPQGMIAFFEKLKEKEKLPEYLKYVSDHPATGDRIEKLKELVSSQASPRLIPEKLLPETDWPGLVKGLGSAD
jgi:Zn-dependent protease with chaperone function